MGGGGRGLQILAREITGRRINIGLVGPMASGKSTLAKLLKSADPRFKILALSTPLKDIASKYFQMGSGLAKDRLLLQKLGKNLKAVDSNFLLRWLVGQIDPQGCHVVEDVRLKAQAERLCEMGFQLVWMAADQATRISRIRACYCGQRALEHIRGMSDRTENLSGLRKYCDYVYGSSTIEGAKIWVRNFLSNGAFERS